MPGKRASVRIGRNLPPALLARSMANRDHVAVLHHVVASLGPDQPSIARFRVAAGAHEVLPADHLGADEAGLDIGVNAARCVPGGEPAAKGSRPRLAAAV